EHGAKAMIDISDGLGADLGHLCEASETGARVYAPQLPVADGVMGVAMTHGKGLFELVCGGGEDFALLAAVPEQTAAEAVDAAAGAEGVDAAVIGEVTAGRGVVLVEPN